MSDRVFQRIERKLARLEGNEPGLEITTFRLEGVSYVRLDVQDDTAFVPSPAVGPVDEDVVEIDPPKTVGLMVSRVPGTEVVPELWIFPVSNPETFSQAFTNQVIEAHRQAMGPGGRMVAKWLRGVRTYTVEERLDRLSKYALGEVDPEYADVGVFIAFPSWDQVPSRAEMEREVRRYDERAVARKDLWRGDGPEFT